MNNVTIKDIANKLGISTASVSRVLNNSGYASEEMREKVFETVKQMNYQPNAIAKSLKINKSDKIGVLIPDISNQYFMSIAKGMEDGLLETDFNLIFASGNEDQEQEQKMLQILSEQRVDYLVLATSGKNQDQINMILQQNIPIVLLDRKIEGLNKKIDMVIEDNYLASRNLTQEIIDLGNRNIGVIAGSMKVSTGRERLQGLKDTLNENGIIIPEKNIFYGNFTLDSGKKACDYFLGFSKEEIPTAFISLNNSMTEGFVGELMEKDRLLTNEFTLGSYGEIEAQKFLNKENFISVKQKPYEMGREVAEIIKTRVSKNSDKNSKEIITCFTPEFSFQKEKIK